MASGCRVWLGVWLGVWLWGRSGESGSWVGLRIALGPSGVVWLGGLAGGSVCGVRLGVRLWSRAVGSGVGLRLVGRGGRLGGGGRRGSDRGVWTGEDVGSGWGVWLWGQAVGLCFEVELWARL